MKLDNISTDQLLFDRQESFNDIVSCLVAKSQGIQCEDRLAGNLTIINTITKECKNRGFDPAQFQENK